MVTRPSIFLPGLLLLMTSVGWVACTQGPSDGSTAGRPGHALAFDGVDDYASTGTAGFPSSVFPQSLTLWMNHTTAAGQQTVMTLRRDNISGIQLGIRDGTLMVWRTYGGAPLVSATALPSSNVWHHVAYTFVPSPDAAVDGAVHTLFVDGVVVGTGTALANNRTPTGAWLGSFDGTIEMFSGLLDEVRVWTTTRSAVDIAAEAAGRPAPDTGDGLVASWRFDETDGAIAHDGSGKRNHATLGDGFASRMPARIPSGVPVGSSP